MISSKEKIFENHLVTYLTDPAKHGFQLLSNSDCSDKHNHIILTHLLSFIKKTQDGKYQKLVENYGSDADHEIQKTLLDELNRKPLWVIIRNGLDVRNILFDLYYPKPRSENSQTTFDNYKENLFSLKPQYHFSLDSAHSVDIVIFLNGLPIISIELKHEDEGQNVFDAIEQFTLRAHDNLIFKLPFLYIAADTSEVKVATNPVTETNFQWFNQGLINQPETSGEYPVEYLYKHALSKDQILEYISFYLIYLPADHSVSEDGIQLIEPERTIFPRYHQLRSNQLIGSDVLLAFNSTRALGKKYLINHSAGSGKTLTMSWLADRLDSLYSNNNQKIFDLTFILTDRKSLDKNIKDELIHFSHLQNKIGYTKHSDELRKFIRQRKSIIATTVHKFAYIQELIEEEPNLKNLRIAFIIDEAHRSQDGKLAGNVRAIFNQPDTPDDEEIVTDGDEVIEEAKKLNLNNQVLIAFTATPTRTTVDFFGIPFDEYTEDEAIKEDYIEDVANNIISYQTLYHLKSRTVIPDDVDYPAGVVHKALQDVAYRDPELIQYKSEVILKYFEDKVKDTIEGKGKAMVVASSRAAGLLFFETLKEKIEKKGLPYKVLFAFSNFTNIDGREINEEDINGLKTIHKDKKIEDVFDDNDDYRIMVVANKFQTGFNQPKLVAMFLDKRVHDVNAVQTLSRLNRKCYGKDTTMVVDFTNSVQEIYRAFRKYRTGTRFEPQEPNPTILDERYKEFLGWKMFNEAQILQYTLLIKEASIDTAKDADLMTLSNEFRAIFKQLAPEKENQREVVSFLNRYVKDFYFISLFFQLPDHVKRFALFSEVISDKLLKKGSTSSLKDHLKDLVVEKSAVRYRGIITNITIAQDPRQPTRRNIDSRPEPPRASIPEVMEDLREVFQINDEEAILINQVIEELMKDEQLVSIIQQNIDNKLFLENYKNTLKQRIINFYLEHNWDDRLEGPYISPGGIIEYMAQAIIRLCSRNVA